MAAMPEDQRAIAEEAINMLSEEQIDVLLDAFGVDLLDEGGVAEEGEEELISEDMPALNVNLFKGIIKHSLIKFRYKHPYLQHLSHY